MDIFDRLNGLFVLFFISSDTLVSRMAPDLKLGQFIVPSQQVPVLIVEIIQSKQRLSGLKGKNSLNDTAVGVWFAYIGQVPEPKLNLDKASIKDLAK